MKQYLNGGMWRMNDKWDSELLILQVDNEGNLVIWKIRGKSLDAN
jgi:hypothetical protein